ncbi:MAG: heavy-metal-associated domain-containing protein, partial [Fimbriimonadaceae bacterium]
MLKKSLSPREEQIDKKMKQVMIKIKGMSCEHCVNSVKSALEAAEGVTAVQVELINEEAVVEGTTFSNESLIKAIQVEGYEA